MFLQTLDRLRLSRKNGNAFSPGGAKAGSRWRSEARAEPPVHDPDMIASRRGASGAAEQRHLSSFFTMPHVTALQQGSRLR
jgi:hypothetical protein